MAFVRFGFILPLTTASAIELSVCSGVGGCLCPIYSKMILIYTASLAIMYKAANYSSVANDIACSIMWAILRTAPLFCGVVESLDKKNWPPALLRDFGSLRYLALLCAASFMALALNVRTAPSCVAM